MNQDGFDRFDSDIVTSKPLAHYHEQSIGKEKEFNFLVVQKMDVEGPSLVQKFVIEPLQIAGSNVYQGTKSAIAQVPSIFKWGAIGLFNKLSNIMKDKLETKTQTDETFEKKEEIAQQKVEENLDDIPVVFVVPQSILEAPLKERLEWIEKHKENCEVFIPRQKAIQLNKIGELRSSSSSSSSPDDCDFDLRRISDEFILQSTASSLFPSVQSIGSQRSKLMQSAKYMMSEEDYKQISQIKTTQKEAGTNQQQTQNIILYPFLGELIPKEQILEQLKNYKLEQSEFTVVQPYAEPTQTTQVSEQQKQFQPLTINGLPFDKQQQQQVEQQKQEKEQITYEEPQRQLEELLEY